MLAQQPGGPWAVLSEPLRKRVKLGERELISSLRIHLKANPGIAQGDRVTIFGEERQVLAASPTIHRTLGHATLLLG